MHDQRTLAFEIGDVLRIWHVDPEQGGDDDSCGWGWVHLTPREIEYATSLITDPHDNLRHWFAGVSELDAEGMIMRIFRLHKTLSRRWWQHPRWHFWHWEIDFPWLQQFKRWAFSRCQHCGGRFRYGEVPIGTGAGTGPKWLRNGECIWHERCHYGPDGKPRKPQALR